MTPSKCIDGGRVIEMVFVAQLHRVSYLRCSGLDEGLTAVAVGAYPRVAAFVHLWSVL